MATALSPAALIVLLACMGLLNSLGSDLLIPALPALQADLGSTAWQAQQTISLFFIASAFMSLWYGAIADAYGRRRCILTALVILAIAAAASALPDDIEQLWALRVVQGLAAGSGMVISRAILHDLHHGHAAQHLLGRITLLQTLSLIATPLLGAWLASQFGWRAVFLALGAICATLAAIYWRWLPESLPPERRQSLHPLALARAYLGALGTPRFLRLTLGHVANWTSMAIYVVSAPVIVITLLGRTATDIYLIYGPITLGLSAGFLVFPLALRRLGGRRVLGAAYAVLALAVLTNLLLAALWPAGSIGLLSLLFYSFGLALALPLLIGNAMESLRHNTGIAASLQIFLQFAMIAVAAGLLAPWLWGSLFSLALGSGALTLAGAVAVFGERQAAPVAG